MKDNFKRLKAIHWSLLVLALPALGQELESNHPLDCVLEPYEVVEVSSAVHGVINEIHVERNDMVGKGQLLVELDSNVERTQVDLARAKAKLQTDIEFRETELAFSQRNQQRLEKLYQTDTISLHLIDEAETDTRKSRLQLRSARDAKRLAELELAEAEALLALRSMRSPISGVVVARNRVAGEFVEDESILRLAQLDPLKVEVIAPVQMFGSITEGMLVEVMPEHAGKGPHYATITMVDRVIDPASGTFDVRAELPNPELAIPSGLRCTVEFLDATEQRAVLAAMAAQPASDKHEPETERMAITQATPLASDASPARASISISEQPHTDPTQPTADLAAAAPAQLASAKPETAANEFCQSPPTPVNEGYFVLADPSNNFVEASELLEKLRENGVDDIFLLDKGANQGQVSLGYYSMKNNAEQRQQAVTSQGFVVSIVARTRTTKRAACAPPDQFAGTSN